MLLALVPSCRKEKIDMHAANIFSVLNLKKTVKNNGIFALWT